jgi:hypothetical protein
MEAHQYFNGTAIGYSLVPGGRVNSSLKQDPSGFLVLREADTKTEPVCLRSDGERLHWDVDDDYLSAPPLYGRPFIHGTFDCYTFLRDFYEAEYGITLPKCDYESSWWNKGKDYYRENIKLAGFKVVDAPLQVGDVVAMRIMSGVINHTAVYIGNGNIAHHLGGKESVIEPFRPAYMAWVNGYYRHEEI